MKRIYFQPEVLVTHVAMESVVLAGSIAPAPPSGDIDISPIPTDDQW